MSKQDQLRRLAQRLLNKTRAREVNWIQSDANSPDNTLELILNGSSVQVLFRSPSVEPDEVELRVNGYTANGSKVAIESFTALEGDDDWALLHDLYTESTKVVLGWDRVMNELEIAVNSGGRIGRGEPTVQTVAGGRGGK